MQWHKAVRGWSMAMGMFTAIPWPDRTWQEDSVPWMLPELPVVGLFIGLIWWWVGTMLQALGLAAPLLAAFIALFGYAVSGGLHLDGYLDVCDALLSRRVREEKLRILKDPHAGAFAIIMLGGLFIVQYASALSIVSYGQAFTGLLPIAVFSRGMTALLVMTRKPIETSGYAKMFEGRTTGIHRAMVWGCMVGCALAAALLGGLRMLIALLGMAAAFALCTWHAERQLGGINGDVAGYALTIAECCGLFILAC